VALRAVERKASANRQVRNEVKDDGPKLSTTGYPAGAPAQVAGTLLKTNEQLEHMLEVALVLFVGAAVATAGIRLEALWFAALLFLVIRPLAVAPVLALSGYSSFDAGAIAWFGIRGIGSLYYLLYALERGLPEELGQQLVSLTLSIIALSILVHGISVTPLLERRKRQTN
jgi:NhaP-type Na+/H+ or K+/H+ antiporter